jgi:hypothetical protein
VMMKLKGAVVHGPAEKLFGDAIWWGLSDVDLQAGQNKA